MSNVFVLEWGAFGYSLVCVRCVEWPARISGLEKGKRRGPGLIQVWILERFMWMACLLYMECFTKFVEPMGLVVIFLIGALISGIRVCMHCVQLHEYIIICWHVILMHCTDYVWVSRPLVRFSLWIVGVCLSDDTLWPCVSPQHGHLLERLSERDACPASLPAALCAPRVRAVWWRGAEQTRKCIKNMNSFKTENTNNNNNTNNIKLNKNMKGSWTSSATSCSSGWTCKSPVERKRDPAPPRGTSNTISDCIMYTIISGFGFCRVC